MNQDRIEDRYPDVLQNLEFAIIQVARRTPELTDWHVQFAVETLTIRYKAEADGKECEDPSSRLDSLSQDVYGAMLAMAEWRLGRSEARNEDDEPVEIPFEPITAQEMVDCLKRIRKSIDRWTKARGRKGYLSYIDQFLPPAPEEAPE